MSASDSPDGGNPPAGTGRDDNGLRAPAYVPLTDVNPDLGRHLLTALGRARIAAYLGPAVAPTQVSRRLFVASDERSDARTIVAAAVRALGEPAPDLPAAAPDPLEGVDTDAEFDALVADWHVDTHNAVREAERELRSEDAEWRSRLSKNVPAEPDWLDEEHYVPPPPPPLPRLTPMTVFAVVLFIGGLALLSFGARLGLPGNLPLILGIGGLLGTTAILVSRLRDTGLDDDDDGAAL